MILTITIVTIISVIIIINITLNEHPNSSSKNLGDDAKDIIMPKTGLKSKKVAVIGGGISGLTACKYLLEAGAKVTLLEKRNIVGGNNDPYLENNKHYATTVIVTYPCQQPHYLNLCREYNLEQTPHDFSKLAGQIILPDRKLTIKMGNGFWSFVKYVYQQCSLKELIDGLQIMFLFY